MSRSLHTEPKDRIAVRRLIDPHSPRSELRWSAAVRKAGCADAPEHGALRLPRVTVVPSRPGHLHPASRADVVRLMHVAGPETVYGLRSIELKPSGQAARMTRLHAFARLTPPGRIVLFEVPCSPWMLRGRLPAPIHTRLASSGAEVVYTSATDTSVVAWPAGALRRFMLLDVLLHEIGHHVLQHHKGKRLATIARTRDHEAFAEGYAARLRARCAATLDLP